MDKITLGDIAAALGFVVALAGSIAAIVHFVRRALKLLFEKQLEDINARFDHMESRLSDIDIESCKNFIVTFMGEVERGEQLDEAQKQRFFEQYEHYTKVGGNSYIKHRYEELHAAGKL